MTFRIATTIGVLKMLSHTEVWERVMEKRVRRGMSIFEN